VLARLARVFLVVALLAGWQAALQHPIEHVDHLGGFVHGSSPHDGSVPLCDALDALTACAPHATPPLVASEQPEQRLPSQHQGAPRVADAPPFLSQGPPASV